MTQQTAQTSFPEAPAPDFTAMRMAMVSNQLRTTAVNDARVVEAMRTVPRERFVPPARAALAYVDTLVPLGGGRYLNSAMATGRLLTAAELRPSDRALVVGAATGYGAAVLARLVASVVALEEDAALAAMTPADMGFERVTGPLPQGWAANAPYDFILIDGAVETIPHAIVEQLAAGGRLAAGLVTNGVTRLVIGRKAGQGSGAFGTIAFADAEAAPLPGFAPPPTFRF